jgi:hypothetical protein
VKSRFIQPEPGRGISLGVEIDEEDGTTGQGKPGRKIDSGRRLSNAALLVDDCECLPYVVTVSLGSSGH